MTGPAIAGKSESEIVRARVFDTALTIGDFKRYQLG
jgi:hypothetical protein